MATELERFRDHCRKMAGSPVAPGCPAAEHRALWIRLADEIDAYLAGDLFTDEQPKGTTEDVALWEVTE
jgi:hypothetical protein